MTDRDLIDILPGRLFYVDIANMTAKLINLPKFMILAYASSVSTGIFYARRDEPRMLTDGWSILTKCSKFNSDHSIRAVRYKPPRWCQEQVDYYNAVKQSDESSKTDWREYLSLADDSSINRDKFITMLTQLESIWD